MGINNQITNPSLNAAFMLPRPTVDERNRLQRYIEYLDGIGGHWSHDPDLAAYRDYLIGKGLKGSTVKAYVVAVRARYKQLMLDNKFIDMLYESVPNQDELSIADIDAVVRKYLRSITNAVDPKAAPVVVKKVQDKADSQHKRLTPAEAMAVMEKPGLTTLRGIRNTAILTLMFCTGLRREEVCNLQVSDLYETLQGHPALMVREGKGCKQRLVIYGEYYSLVAATCGTWMTKARISEGYLFRALLRPHGDKATDEPMSVRTLNVVFEGLGITPHDTRRTYAKWLELSGMPIQEIKRQLGHESVDTTLLYIGDQDVTRRVPKSVLVSGD